MQNIFHDKKSWYTYTQYAIVNKKYATFYIGSG